MKDTNPSSVINGQQKIESENINVAGQGITKRLIEKYKHKGLNKIEYISPSNDKKRVD